MDIPTSLKEFQRLYDNNKENPELLSQVYKIMNYKPSHLINKSNTLSPLEIRNFLAASAKQGYQGYSTRENIDDPAFYDDSQLKEIVMKQNFLISKGLFDPSNYFPSIPVPTLEDKDIDKKILEAINMNRRTEECLFAKLN